VDGFKARSPPPGAPRAAARGLVKVIEIAIQL
jgi:hypothetical protein